MKKKQVNLSKKLTFNKNLITSLSVKDRLRGGATAPGENTCLPGCDVLYTTRCPTTPVDYSCFCSD